MTRISLLGALSLTAVVACAAEDPETLSMGEGAGGKADDTSEVDEDTLSVRIAAHDSEDRVETNCHGETGFVAKALCEQAGLFDKFTSATSCPQSMSILKPEGAGKGAQRCIDDDGKFVASACCAPLCDAEAAWDGESCRASNGQTEDALCCFLNDARDEASCDGTAWETMTVEQRGEKVDRTVCRNQDTGKFALNTCCASNCLEAIGEQGVSTAALPSECLPEGANLTSPGVECPADAAPNSANLCHNPANGRFLPSACCEARLRTETDRGDGRRDELDREGSDRCFEKPEGCLTDEFVCSFNQPSFIGDTTVDLDADGDELTVGDELTDHQTAVLHAAAELTFGRSFQGEDVDVLFEIDDEETVIITDVRIGSRDLTWIQFFAGDNEVGYFFTVADDGAITVIAEVSDQDIKACRRAEVEACPEDVDEEVVLCMDDWLRFDVGIDPETASQGDFADAADFCREGFFSDGSFADALCSDAIEFDGCFDERLDQAEACFDQIIDAGGFDRD